MQTKISISFDINAFRVVYSETMCYTRGCITLIKPTLRQVKLLRVCKIQYQYLVKQTVALFTTIKIALLIIKVGIYVISK